MSQNDFNIANQGFPSFRSDLNSALQALASNSAGATEPSTTYAYQWWYDETTDKLKIRNADNDAWIDFATFDQTADTWSLASLVVDTDTLVVDSANNRVGVGTVSPATELDVDGTIKSTNISDGTTSVGTSYVVNGSAKVTWRYDQTTPSITDSFNVSSVSDDTTGEYTVNYTNNFANANYIPVTHCIHVDSGSVLAGANVEGSSGTGPALNLLVGEVSIIVQNSNGSNLDMDFSSGLIQGDLA